MSQEMVKNKTEERPLYKDLQRRLVASILKDSSSIDLVLELISEEDIEEVDLSLIFNAVATLARADKIISPVTVSEVLEKDGLLKEAGGTTNLYQLYVEGEHFLLEASPEIYARIIKESSAKAKTSRTLTDFANKFKDDSGFSASDTISELQSDLNEKLLKLSDSSTVYNVSKTAADYLQILDERREVTEKNNNSDGLQGIPSLLHSLNKYTTGWAPGQIITVGAGTGIGKSIFAVNCAMAAAISGSSVLFFSLEMSEKEIMDRIYSSSAQIPLSNLKHGTLSKEERERLISQMEKMKDMKIIIDTEPKQSIDTIRARSLRQAQSPEGLDFIIIDYLQLVKSTGKFSNRQEAVADISRNTKLLAKQLNVPIMVLVQLNRKKDDDDNTVPTLNNIRESAAIAMDSDIVILLHRNDSSDNDGTTPLTSVILEKQRGGVAHKTIKCHSNLEYSLFREIRTSKNAEINDENLEDEEFEEDFSDDTLEDEDMDFSDFDEEDD